MSNPIYSRSTRLKVNKAYPFLIFNVLGLEKSQKTVIFWIFLHPLDFYHNMVYNKKGREDCTPLFKSPSG